MDFLFSKGRTPWVFMDKEATKIGAIFSRDMENGEAFTAFDEKAFGTDHVEATEYDHVAHPEEA
jgi:hypothetical protein